MWFVDPWGCLRSFQEIHVIKTLIIKYRTLLTFFTVLIFALIMQKHIGDSTWIKALAGNHDRSYYTLHCHASTFKKSQFHLKMSLMKHYKLLVLLNLYPCWVHIFLTFSVTRLDVHIKHFCTVKYGVCLKEKHLYSCFELQAELTTLPLFIFPCNTTFSNYSHPN